MAWIKTISEDEAQGQLKEVYTYLAKQRGGRFGNILRVHSLNPEALRRGADFMWWLMRGESRLTTAQREMIATAVSAALHCRY
ncbi:MAG: carboxymuconolactone decarboxylase family protein [Candidatus Binatia bacterium]